MRCCIEDKCFFSFLIEVLRYPEPKQVRSTRIPSDRTSFILFYTLTKFRQCHIITPFCKTILFYNIQYEVSIQQNY